WLCEKISSSRRSTIASSCPSASIALRVAALRGCSVVFRRVGIAGSERATDSVCSLPPCGGGVGRGVARCCSIRASHNDPHPPRALTRATLPHKGEGKDRDRGAVIDQYARSRTHVACCGVICSTLPEARSKRTRLILSRLVPVTRTKREWSG